MAEKAAEKKSTPATDRPRAFHLLVLPDPNSTTEVFLDFEPFTGELDARRALDCRPGWKYLALIPGASYKARQGQRS